MSVKRNGRNVVYGLTNATQLLSPEPIFAQRVPSSDDSAAIGTFWFYRPTNAQVQLFIYVSAGVWSQVSLSSGQPEFAGLTVNGVTELNGQTTINAAGNFNLQGASVSASAAFTVVNNALVGQGILTGNTLAQSASQSLTLTNSNITATNNVLYSVSCNQVAGDALLTVTGAVQSAGSMVITVENNGGATGLAAGDSIMISFMVLG